MQYILFFSFVLSSFIILRELLKNRYLALSNPFFWTLTLIVFYFLIPSYFLPEINYYYSWNLNDTKIICSQIISILLILIFSFFLFTIKTNRHFIKSDKKNIYHCSGFIKTVWKFITIYLFFVLLYKYQASDIFITDNYTGEAYDPFKIKNIAYLLVSVSVFYYFNNPKLWIFSPNIILILIDVMSGSRTSSLIVAVPMIISVCIYHKRLYLIPSILLIILFIVIGIIRSDNVVKNVPWYLDAIGEFRETFITLPLILFDGTYITQGDLKTLLLSFIGPILYPFRDAILSSIKLPGEYLYHLVDRGYGLGSNIITESIYYGYLTSFISIGLFILLCFIFNEILKKSSPPILCIIISYFVIFSRLIIREGFFYNFGIFIFILLIYFLPVFIAKKLKLKLKLNKKLKN